MKRTMAQSSYKQSNICDELLEYREECAQSNKKIIMWAV
jgi:hypothetical protein